jgi:hypothetical protein
VFIGTAGLWAQEGSKVAPDSPHLQFDSTEIDLGDIDRGSVAVAGFTVRNVGDQPVRIERVKPG